MSVVRVRGNLMQRRELDTAAAVVHDGVEFDWLVR
jgi:hypothetical protein